ncbi:MAG: response regulator [Deltaproteobacteria bacterium]|nr:response regulator [Deltaproteobacteria bacterium]
MKGVGRILIVEDESDLQKVLKFNLEREGFEVLQAFGGEDALRLAREHRPDMVLLDLMLPDLPGTGVCKALKADSKTKRIPVVILTAKGEEIDRVLGFELGADDYVVKPFSVRELLLRLRAVLKRNRGEAGETPLLTFGRLSIDRDAHRIWVDGREVDLTALELKLLLTLHDRRNRVQTRSTLLDDVWGISAEIETRTVDTHVKRLREKLGAAGDYIETVRGVGYRFAEAPDDGPPRGARK